mmetsp:Transcript_17567/g.26671  ORF Transcript_17567/g.26671 Transcript_17567/m.26671 type:complete len:400 (-) Transcript_17567:58-1257(-)
MQEFYPEEKTKMTIREVTFPSADDDDDNNSFRLHGSLKLPSSETSSSSSSSLQKIAAVLIVNGSGPIDRHGNVRMPSSSYNIMSLFANMDLNTSNMMSDFLVHHKGIASLTYDKRGIGKSVSHNNKDANIYYKAGVSDLVSDAVQAYKFLVTSEIERLDVNHIFLLGHSEGAILLPLILQQLKQTNEEAATAAAAAEQQSMPLPRGLIFLCGFGECIRDVTGHQRETLVKEVQEQHGIKGWLLRQILTKERLERQYQDTLKKINDRPNSDYLSTYLGMIKQPAKWMREHLALEDLRTELSQVNVHCLAVAGGNDCQVRSEFCQTEVAQELVPQAASLETYILPHLTHVLRSMKDRPCQLLDATTEYPRLAKLPLDSELLSIVGKWCHRIMKEEESESNK